VTVRGGSAKAAEDDDFRNVDLVEAAGDLEVEGVEGVDAWDRHTSAS